MRVVVVDDHPAVRAGVRAILDAELDLEVVGEAGTASDGEAACVQRRPDVVVMDLRLGDGDGAAVARTIRDRSPSARVLMLTSYDGDESIHRALEAGARGYVLKDAAPDELVAAVRAVAAGRRHVPAEVAIRLAESGPRVELTPRETDVLHLLAEGLRNKEIGARLGLSEATVRTHVQGVLAKFGCHDRGAAIAAAIARGFFVTQDATRGMR